MTKPKENTEKENLSTNNLCTMCWKRKDYDEFYYKKDGTRTGYCKACQNIYASERYYRLNKIVAIRIERNL